jgi:hypothetical protein
MRSTGWRAWCGVLNALVVLAGCVVLASGAPPEEGDGLRPGEIVIKPTGKKRLVRTAAAPTTRPATRPADDAGAPPARVVSIGYIVREPEERGWGPQIHYAEPHFSYSSCGYGYDAPIWDSAIFPTRSYFGGYGGYGGFGHGGGYRTSSFDHCRFR